MSDAFAAALSKLGKPYFRRGRIALYQGDALDLLGRLPAGLVDVVCTDPPYASGGRTIGERQAATGSKYEQNGQTLHRPDFLGDGMDQRSWTRWTTTWLSRCRSAAADRAYLLAFIDWRQFPALSDAIQCAGWTWRGSIVWDKGNAARAPHTGFFSHQAEFCLWASNGGVLRRPTKQDGGGKLFGVFRHSVRQTDKFHQAGKPTPLMVDLLRCAPTGGLVLDPFAGSSSSAIAAAELGLAWIGFELAEAYAEISAERIRRCHAGEVA